MCFTAATIDGLRVSAPWRAMTSNASFSCISATLDSLLHRLLDRRVVADLDMNLNRRGTRLRLGLRLIEDLVLWVSAPGNRVRGAQNVRANRAERLGHLA